MLLTMLMIYNKKPLLDMQHKSSFTPNMLLRLASLVVFHARSRCSRHLPRTCTRCLARRRHLPYSRTCSFALPGGGGCRRRR